jgi:hypothetical protein
MARLGSTVVSRGRRSAVFLSAGLLLSLAACGESSRAAAPRPAAPGEDDPSVTLVLRAMNTSTRRKSIDIEVAVDGAVVVRDRLTSEGPKDISIPPSKTFPLQLAPGTHALRARSAEAGAEIERDVEIRKKHWALLSYEAGPDGKWGFILNVQDKPIYFE